MEEKKKEKYQQTRYRRELERYLNRIVSFAMGKDFHKSDYEALIDKVDKKLDNVEKIRLYNDYFESLEAFVQKCRDLKESEFDEDEIAAQILHEANRIRKLKRKRSYSRKEKRRGDDEDFG
ncbi:hypothetical protein [Hydrogenimonas sp.]